MDQLADEGKIARALSRVETFDDLVRRAVRSVYDRNFGPLADKVISVDPVLRWDLRALMDDYSAAGAYPRDRLAAVADRAIDLKLQFRFVMMSTEIQNKLVYHEGFDLKNPLATPNTHLMHLSLMQAQIGQIRVLWERLMTLVIYLETGSDPKDSSIRKQFFAALPQWSPKWDVLADCKAVINSYDRDFRTPEYHNRSKLRCELFGAPPTNPNDILTPLTPIMNGFWEVLRANVQGRPHHIGRLGYSITGPNVDGDANG